MRLSSEDVAAVADAVVERLGGPREGLLTIDGAAERLGLSARTVRKMIDEKTLASIVIQNRRLVEPEEVERVIREAREEAA